jgi:hypothetical protein
VKSPRVKLAISLLAGALLLIAAFVLSHHFSEPRHNGKRLTFWLKEYYERYTPRSEEAILTIGTNGIPTLLKLLLHERSRSLSQFIEKTGLPIELIQDNAPVMERRHLATIGFQVLGSNAAPAIPMLLPLLDDSPRSHLASQALVSIGEPALAPIRPYLASTNSGTKRHAVHLVLWITQHARTNLDAFLAHPDPAIRAATYLSIPPPRGVWYDYVLEKLLEGLKDPDPIAASYAAIALRNRGNDATNALPRLYRLKDELKPTNTMVAIELANTIKSLEKRIRLNSAPNTQTNN